MGRSGSALLAGVLLLVLPAATAAAAGAPRSLEMPVLDAFYAGYDRVPGTPYCGRAGGGEEWQDGPGLPVDHVNLTNELFDEHSAWHARYFRVRAGPDPLDDNVTYGDDFVLMHRFMVGVLDAWRAERGIPATPLWDPATPIPPELAYRLPAACQPRRSEDIGVALPSWLTVEGGGEPSVLWGYAALCEFPTLNRLAKEVDRDDLPRGSRLDPSEALPREGPAPAYHSAVHGGVGGDMARPMLALRDPAFWAWHKWLDTRFQLWERACAGREPFAPTAEQAGMRWMAHGHAVPAEEPAPTEAPRATRGTPAAGALAGLAVLAVAARRR